jgi:RHS repeat-associated protein
VNDRYGYSPFGELLWHEGSDSNRYLFSGELFDSHMRISYNRARWMDPALGRFLSPDPNEGAPATPASRLRYTYAANDPLSYVDPSGRNFAGLASVAVGTVAAFPFDMGTLWRSLSATVPGVHGNGPLRVAVVPTVDYDPRDRITGGVPAVVARELATSLRNVDSSAEVLRGDVPNAIPVFLDFRPNTEGCGGTFGVEGGGSAVAFPGTDVQCMREVENILGGRNLLPDRTRLPSWRADFVAATVAHVALHELGHRLLENGGISPVYQHNTFAPNAMSDFLGVSAQEVIAEFGLDQRPRKWPDAANMRARGWYDYMASDVEHFRW